MCPQCQSEDNYCSAQIPEEPYRLAARAARELRDAGDIGAAVDLLTGLAAVRIINFIRPKFKCGCGASFD